MTREGLALLKQQLWPVDAVRPVRNYAVLDCARDPRIYGLICRSYREKACLFAGALDPELSSAAPYLLELHSGDGVTDELLLLGWRSAWGIVIRTESSFHTLRTHLRTLLRVKTEDGRFLLFRFYDPRVLDVFLPTCTQEELGIFFGNEIEMLCGACGDGQNTGFYDVDVDGRYRLTRYAHEERTPARALKNREANPPYPGQGLR